MPESKSSWTSASVEVALDDEAFAKSLQSFDLGHRLMTEARGLVTDVRAAISEQGVLAGVREFRALRMRAMTATARALRAVADVLDRHA
jgi:hypothetical protein